jgi:hypothetical protein
MASLDNNTHDLIHEYKIGMEFWDYLKGKHYAISAYEDDNNWDISGEGTQTDRELWVKNFHWAYSCALITMGESLGMTMEWDAPDDHFQLSGTPRIDKVIAKECFVAFLELHRADIRKHTYYQTVGIEAPDLEDWFDEEEDNDAIWHLEKYPGNDWRRLAIENAIPLSIMNVGPLELTPWTISHLNYVVAHETWVFHACRTIEEARTYAEEHCRSGYVQPLRIYRGKLQEQPKLVLIVVRK